MGNKKSGVCTLTGTRGKFVKSHIIPKALTPRDHPSRVMLQTDGMERPSRRWNSWYDPELVIAKGEHILRDIDDCAIKEIRKRKLAWKYWDAIDELDMEPANAGAVIGLRSLSVVDHFALARFFISVLWRAGSSNLKDMTQFEVGECTLAKAKRVVLKQDYPDSEVFPIKVFQYATKGLLHNLTPMNHELPRPDGTAEPFFRMFFNGLFVHIVDTSKVGRFDLGNAGWYLGVGQPLKILCLDFEKSAQAEFVYSSADHAFR